MCVSLDHQSKYIGVTAELSPGDMPTGLGYVDVVSGNEIKKLFFFCDNDSLKISNFKFLFYKNEENCH